MSDTPVVRPPARGLALLQAADAMVRSLGGAEMTLLFPGTAAASSVSSDLGLQDPPVDEILIAPVCSVFAGMKDARTQTEFLVPATAVADSITTSGSDSAEAFFESALGVLLDGKLLRILSVSAETFAGSAYLYRVLASE